MNTYDKVIQILKKHNIEFKEMQHEPVITSQQAADIRNTDIEQGAKAILLRAKGKFYLFVLSAKRKIDMKAVKNILNQKSVSMATHEEVNKTTGCEIGGVPPFGSAFNTQTYLDRNLTTKEIIDFNAGLRTHSIEMKLKDYLKAENPIIKDFSI